MMRRVTKTFNVIWTWMENKERKKFAYFMIWSLSIIYFYFNFSTCEFIKWNQVFIIPTILTKPQYIKKRGLDLQNVSKY